MPVSPPCDECEVDTTTVTAAAEVDVLAVGVSAK